MPPATARPRASGGTVRIIGGRWKRTPLPVADLAGLRPTPDRIRETVFNWLTHAFATLDDRSALDLYAGSGALGFEAASRGAAPVTLVERHPVAASALWAVRDRLAATAVDIVVADALVAAKRLLGAGARFDVIFLDPPFGSGALTAALPAAAALAAPSGLIYVESDAVVPESAAAAVGFETYRADRAGDVFYHLLQRKKTE